MKGGKLVVILFLLGLSLATWIEAAPQQQKIPEPAKVKEVKEKDEWVVVYWAQEDGIHSTPVPASSAKNFLQEKSLLAPKPDKNKAYLAQFDSMPKIVSLKDPTDVQKTPSAQTPQTVVPEPQPTSVPEVPFELVPAQEPTQAEKPIEQYNQSLDPFDHHNRVPDDRHPRHPHRRDEEQRRRRNHLEHQERRKERKEYAQSVTQSGLMDNSTLFLVLLGVVCFAIVKICSQSNKGRKKGRNCVVQQQYPQKVESVSFTQNEYAAIDAAISHHQTQIMRLRSLPYYQMPYARAMPIRMAYS